jgi:UPF0755 protein
LAGKPKNVSLEGYLFPDTYEVREDETAKEVVAKILSNFDRKVSKDILSKIKNQGKTLYQVLIMASVLEKEVKGFEDKKIVAGILWKRLRNGWKLQVDSTLTYITNRKSLELTKDDLTVNSPYNTYKHYGLPPSPICNPGLDSIKAAVSYKDSPYWFYLTTKDGKTVFSRTLREHNYNRWKYLK